MTISVCFSIGAAGSARSRIINRLSGMNIAGYCARNDQILCLNLRKANNKFRKILSR